MSHKEKCTVVVKFVGDEDVLENIIHISKKNAKERTSVRKSPVLKSPKSLDENTLDDDVVYTKSTDLKEKSDGISGKDIYPVVSKTKITKFSKKGVKKTPIACSDSESNPDEIDSDENDISNNEEITKKKAVFSDYFFNHGNKTQKTSTHTLSDLKLNTSGTESWKDLMEQLPDLHQKEKNSLHQKYKSLFSKWCLLIGEGFNILLYGLGSKIHLMEDFYKNMLPNSEILVVNGFFPGLTIKQILNMITEDIIKHNGTFHDLVDQVTFIKQHINGKEITDLYLIINNIDAPLLRSEKNQSLLSLLVQSSHIHIVASIDHINAPLIWDQVKLSRYNWIWFDVTSFCEYNKELSYENSLLTQKHGKLALSSLLHVFNSLTPNAQGIFLIIARYQHEQKDSTNYIGMSFQDCYQHCREAFLVNSELTLRAQLTEFRDHKLLRSRKNADGVEHLYLLLDENTISEFLELQDES